MKKESPRQLPEVIVGGDEVSGSSLIAERIALEVADHPLVGGCRCRINHADIVWCGSGGGGLAHHTVLVAPSRLNNARRLTRAILAHPLVNHTPPGTPSPLVVGRRSASLQILIILAASDVIPYRGAMAG